MSIDSATNNLTNLHDIIMSFRSSEIGSGMLNQIRDTSEGVKESLRKFHGKVVHAIAQNGMVLRYRIGTDGKIKLEKTIKSINLQSEKIREKIYQAGKNVPEQAQKSFREVVTGDPNKRLRDFLKEVPQVKMLDKLSFTLGVLTIILSEFISLRLPNWFPMYYYLIITLLFGVRYFTYKKEKYQFFMLDACYFINVSCVLQTAFFPNNLAWFKTNFVFCMGPLSWGILVWKNSLVFHSHDKLSSFFIHAFPPMLCHLYRWKMIETDAIKLVDSLSFFETLVFPIFIHLIWQFSYLYITEILLRLDFEEDPDLITSYRYLCRDKKSAIHLFATNFCRSIKVFRSDETFEYDSFKSKLIFVVFQLLYTAFTMSLVFMLYSNYYISCLHLVAMYFSGTWNGASYYIEIFSQRYNLKFTSPTTETVEETIKLNSKTEEDASSVFESSKNLVNLFGENEKFKGDINHYSPEEEQGVTFEDSFKDHPFQDMYPNGPLTVDIYNEILEQLEFVVETGSTLAEDGIGSIEDNLAILSILAIGYKINDNDEAELYFRVRLCDSLEESVLSTNETIRRASKEVLVNFMSLLFKGICGRPNRDGGINWWSATEKADIESNEAAFANCTGREEEIKCDVLVENENVSRECDKKLDVSCEKSSQ